MSHHVSPCLTSAGASLASSSSAKYFASAWALKVSCAARKGTNFLGPRDLAFGLPAVRHPSSWSNKHQQTSTKPQPKSSKSTEYALRQQDSHLLSPHGHGKSSKIFQDLPSIWLATRSFSRNVPKASVACECQPSPDVTSFFTQPMLGRWSRLQPTLITFELLQHGQLQANSLVPEIKTHRTTAANTEAPLKANHRGKQVWKQLKIVLNIIK